MQITLATGRHVPHHVICRAGSGWYQIEGSTWSTGALCPDHLRLGDLGVADTWRGRLVRLALWLLR